MSQRQQGGCLCCISWKEQRQRQEESFHVIAITVVCSDATTRTTRTTTNASRNGRTLWRLFVLRNARVFTLTKDDNNSEDNEEIHNDDEGECFDVWVAGGKIWALTPWSPRQENDHENDKFVGDLCPSMPMVREINVRGLTICPGWVDMHQHVAGGGGEAGLVSRTPRARIEDLLNAGVTTFVATLGTDTVTKNMVDLIATTRALAMAGNLTGLAWLGGYTFPTSENTITGNVGRDIMLLPELVGVGELAISDHRGSYPTVDELLRLVSQVRVAGSLLSNKAGVTYFHVGEDATGLEPLRQVVARNPVLRQHMVPTHMERSEQLIQEGMQWMQNGGYIDFSGWKERQRVAIRSYRQTKQGRQLIRHQLSISSDSFGSINVFDSNGKLIKYSYGLPETLLQTFLSLVYLEKLSMDTALRFFCRNSAKILRLDQGPRYKGQIRVGGDADLLVLQLPSRGKNVVLPETTRCSFGFDWPVTKGVIQYVIAGGRVVRAPGLSEKTT